MASAENIITLTRNLLREEDGSDVPVIADSFLFEAIMDGQGKWEDAYQSGGESSIENKSDTGFDLIADTTLDESSGITPASADFTVDTAADYDASNGAVLMWDDNMPDFVSYGTYSAKEFTVVTGIGFKHEDEDTVQALYKLPTNFGSFRESAVYGDGVRMNGTPFRFMSDIPVDGFFSEYNDGTNRFLVLPRSSTGSVSVQYNKEAGTIDDLQDTVSVPDKYKFFLVYHCMSVVYEDVVGDITRATRATNKAESKLLQALQNRNTGKKIRTRPFGRTARDSVSVGGHTYPFSY